MYPGKWHKAPLNGKNHQAYSGQIHERKRGIPCIYRVDQIHGTTYTAGRTSSHKVLTWEAFNRPTLLVKGSRISAYETKAGSIPWTYAPVVDLGATLVRLASGRTTVKIPYLNAEMGRRSVLGFQG